MKTKQILLAAGITAALGAGGYGLWWLGMSQGMQMASGGMDDMAGHDHAAMMADAGDMPMQAGVTEDPSNWTIPQGEAATRRHMEQGIKAGDVDPVTGLRVLYYHDPMVPGRNFDAPSKSPFMDMMLVPEYAGAGGGDTSSVTISPRVQQNLGIRVGAVSKAELGSQTVVDGIVQWNERERSVIQARAEGFVEKLHVTATLDSVKRGQALITVYVPSWVAAQQEYLALNKMQGNNVQPLIEAARQRMIQLGMTTAQIAQVTRSGQVQARLAITAPRAGVVTQLEVREGMTIKPGMTLLEINGIDTVWVDAQVPEAQAYAVAPGAPVLATTAAHPGKVFDGQVQTILPQVNANTRTLQARLTLQNADRSLLPGLFVKVQLADKTRRTTLAVPTEAVFYTGQRAMVVAVNGENAFLPVEVKTGLEVGGKTEILEGLAEGDRVVLSGQFLLDSEASLRGLQARLLSDTAEAMSEANTSTDTETTDNKTQHAIYTTTAILEDLEEAGLPLMTHPPIPELNWPEMTMQFQLPVEKEAGLQPGQEYTIDFQMQDGGLPLITRIQPAKGQEQGQGGERD